MTDIASIEPLLLSVPDVAKVIGLGKSKTWELVLSGEIESVKIDARRLITREAIQRFVNGLGPE